ncbi:MAG: hypothetical protein AUI10_11465 [Actinobacteria bacterium 13_2_20CM_2_72_6]|nr:MAG: hypothetical protein AUI10_11465 [Actinobacteria bacterium 13_2_20CM_2_72_6]
MASSSSMCLAWSCTSSSTNVSVGECRSASALPTMLRSSPLALSRAAAVPVLAAVSPSTV